MQLDCTIDGFLDKVKHGSNKSPKSMQRCGQLRRMTDGERRAIGGVIDRCVVFAADWTRVVYLTP